MFLYGCLTDTVPGSFAKYSVINKRASLPKYVFAELFWELHGAILVFHVVPLWRKKLCKIFRQMLENSHKFKPTLIRDGAPNKSPFFFLAFHWYEFS